MRHQEDKQSKATSSLVTATIYPVFQGHEFQTRSQYEFNLQYTQMLFTVVDTSEVLPTKRRGEEMDTLVMDTKLKIIEILKVKLSSLI